jgi:hypothetical protein
VIRRVCACRASMLHRAVAGPIRSLVASRPTYHPDHPLGCHKPCIRDRIVFDRLVQVLVFGCSYEKIADASCSATAIRDRRDEWIRLGVFAELERIVVDNYDRIIGLELEELAVDGCITKAPGGGQVAGRSRSTEANKA